MRAVRLVVAVVVASAAVLAVAAPALAAPANDQVSGAQVVGPGLPVTVPATTAGATAEAGETVFSTNKAHASVWFKWTPGASAKVFIDVCTSNLGTAPDNEIAVYTGSAESWAGLTKVAQEAGACKFQFAATAGVTYKIQVDFLDNREPQFTFRIRNPAPPANDNYTSPQGVGSALPISVAASNVDSTAEAEEPTELGGASARSVWFSWTAPKTE